MTEATMSLRFLKFITGRACCKQQAASSLPKGFEAAPPIKNEKLRELLEGPDITTSGGIHLVSDGQPLLKRQEVHH